MGDDPGDEDGHRVEPQPFSIVLAPAATVAIERKQQQWRQQRQDRVLVRYLHCCARKPPHGRASRTSKQSSPHLSSTVVVVRAQPQTLHFFRGSKLSRVVNFPSPVEDVTAGLPWGSPSPQAAASTNILCVAVCRDGAAYALPVAEVLDGVGRVGNATDRSAKAEIKPTAAGGGNAEDDADCGLAGASERKRGSRSLPSCVAVGIFDDLAPTILDESQEQEQERAPPPREVPLPSARKHENGGTTTEGGSGGVRLGGLAMEVHKRWAVFNHPGARTVASCSDGGTTAVAGIIERAASYGVATAAVAVEAKTTNGAGARAVGRNLGTLCGVDGAAPTTSCMVWMEDVSSALGDGKGFPLPSPVFRYLFGSGSFGSGSEYPQLSAQCSSDPGTVEHSDHVGRPMPASVVLIGDAAGTVRWSPVPPRAGFSGGVLASLPGETTAIVATVPQLDAESRAVGVLLVGANGAVLSLAASTVDARSPCGSGSVSRKRPRHDHAGEGGGHGRGETCGGSGKMDRLPPRPPSISPRVLGLPFPVTSACSAPGFLLHCHAGALFATAVPAAGEGGPEEDTLRPRTKPEPEPFERFETPPSERGAAPVLPLRPVRLPLPCDTVGVAVAPVLIDDDIRPAMTSSTSNGLSAAAAAGAASAVPRTLVMSVSARGRLVGFMAPQSAEELDSWTLDVGKGGLRVGGGAGVERHVRCQLEQLSNLGRQCAALSAESAVRDREIRILRGAAKLLPPLVAATTDRSGVRGGSAPAPPGCLAHTISMAPETKEEAAGFADSYAGGGGPWQSDALQVRLCVRLCAREGGRAKEALDAVGGEDGAGRWFIVTRVVAESGGGDGGDDETIAGEGWAWSASAVVPMASLRQGWPWSSSVALTLPSARPVTATSWLQFRFGGDGDGKASSGDDELGPHSEAAGVCVELGSSRFDVLDWSVKLSSVPRSAAAVRAACRGVGSSFCGPELAIADIFGRCSAASGGGGGSSSDMDRGFRARSAAARPTVPTAWSNFRLRLASQERDAGALLALLVPVLTSPPPATSRQGGGRSGGGGGNQVEVAIRVAGQVAILRATGCTKAAGGAAGGGGGSGQARAAAGSRIVELAVRCSNAAMAPLVREALLRRGRVLANDRGPEVGGGSVGSGSRSEEIVGRVGIAAGCRSGDVVARGDTAARLVREVHPIKQAVADAGDAAGALCASRASVGPSAESAKESLALMYRVGEIYQSLRRQQECVGLLL